MVSHVARVGFYGKLPIMGDFISRRLPTEFIEPWDQWLQTGLVQAEQLLGEQWLDYYLTCPVLRFALSPGIIGGKIWLGVLMSSVDKVGRYFPLTLAIALEDERFIDVAFSRRIDFFDKLEDIALSGLAENYSLEAFDEALCSVTLALPEQTQQDVAHSHLLSRVCVDQLCLPHELHWKLSVAINSNNLPAYSLWVNSASEHSKGSVSIYHDLPSASDFSSMISQ